MQYRRFGKLDFQVSVLGFGVMRLPVRDNNYGDIIEDESTHMIRHAIDQGVNYLDTAYFYHTGRAEEFLGRALRNGYRDKVKIATKMPCSMVQSYADFDRIFHEQLQRLQTDRIDFYLAHGLNKEAWTKMLDMNYLSWAETKLASGQIRHLGFSFHDQFEVFKSIVDDYANWDFCQIQYNFMDIEYQAGIRGLKYAVERGLGVVVMEPVRGGQLSKNLPPEVLNLWESAPIKRSPAAWAFLWVWEHPEVSVALSGMSTLEQLNENMFVADHCGPGVLTEMDLALVKRVREAYAKLSVVPCTGCRYCLPCPNNVAIPHIFELYNNAIMYHDPEMARRFYTGNFGLKQEQKADNCITCAECIYRCPQHIYIPEQLKKAHHYLTSADVP